MKRGPEAWNLPYPVRVCRILVSHQECSPVGVSVGGVAAPPAVILFFYYTKRMFVLPFF